MRTVTKSELSRHTAEVLDQVDADGPVVVTERGVPRWRISAFVAGAVDELIASNDDPERA